MIRAWAVTLLAAAGAAGAAGAGLAAPPQFGAFAGRPDATVDLDTTEGLALVKGAWRYADARLVPAEFRAAGPDRKPSGARVSTLDLVPRAGAAGFDDGAWAALAPGTLDARRGNGKLSFGWYRLRLTLPERIGGTEVAGSTVVFEIVADDYAEVLVDGAQPHPIGQPGGPVIAGYNAPNRVVIARDARPGQVIQLAVLVANGPFADLPANYVWVRSATLDVYRAPRRPADAETALRVDRLDPGLDAVVPPGATIEKVAGGFSFTEGPVAAPDGALLFSDPNDNAIYRLAADGTVSVARSHSGYAGGDIGEYRQPGSNGLGFDAEGRLTICEHGNRRVTRVEKNGVLTVLADRYQGKRLNSPNDLVYRSDGTLFFSDPPFGLPRFHEDPRRELPVAGVYRLKDGDLKLVVADLAGPNGVALSPDEKYLYVGNWDPARKVVMRYAVREDGTLHDARVFLDLTREPGEEAIDGIEVDREGRLFVSGPGGVFVVAPDGRRLGLLHPPEQPANFAWGDDGHTLYMTARTSVYRVRLR